VNVKNKSSFLGILASIFMFEGQNLGQRLLYVIEWPLVTSNLDQSECFTSHCKAYTQSFHLSGHSSNSIKNWPFQIKLYLPYPQICASFWKPTSSINHWISTLLPVVWTSTLIFWCPGGPSIQIKWQTAWHSLACKWPLAPGVSSLYPQNDCQT